MSLHPDSNQLLQAIPVAIDGVSVCVLDADGERTEAYGVDPVDGDSVRVALPAGELVAEIPASAPSRALVASLLDAIAQRERLEMDMDSMNSSSVRLLEQVAMMGETLPKLSGGGDDAEIAAMGAHACNLAAGVDRVIFSAAGKRLLYFWTWRGDRFFKKVE